MHRTPLNVVIPNLSESLKKYANLCKLGNKIMLIYKINFFLLTLFSVLIYIFCGRALQGRAGCRQTEVQTNRQTKSRTYAKNWRTDNLCLLRQRIGEQSLGPTPRIGEQTKNCQGAGSANYNFNSIAYYNSSAFYALN